ATASEVEQFLEQVQKTPLSKAPDGRGKLIFAMDATASRQPTWDRATQLQGDMFLKTKGIGALDVQLLYYRGHGECRASNWVNKPQALLKLMQSVHCAAGTTQIGRLIRHALGESETTNVQALVFIGDCVEEDADSLAKLAGKLKIIGLPMFIFQEGHDAFARRTFAQLAKISGGAYCAFDQNSPQRLGELLNAVAAYAAGGREALQKLSRDKHGGAALLLEQLGN
ncbi:MAG: VWA domain-containing protein, partial [Gammaproteobacteria bacterium]|nr:VWA domain-containing protein [Gammaproteobacteria bacterium]